MFRVFKKAAPKPKTLTEKVMVNGTQIEKTYVIEDSPTDMLREIHKIAKDQYSFKTIMAALDAIQTRLNNIECRVMDLDDKVVGRSDKLKERILGISIEEFARNIELTPRAFKLAKSMSGCYHSLKDLLDEPEEAILKYPGLGTHSWNLIKEGFYGTSTYWNERRYQLPDFDWKRLADKLGIKE